MPGSLSLNSLSKVPCPIASFLTFSKFHGCFLAVHEHQEALALMRTLCAREV